MSLASLESDSFGCLHKMTIGLEGNDVIFRWNKYLQQQQHQPCMWAEQKCICTLIPILPTRYHAMNIHTQQPRRIRVERKFGNWDFAHSPTNWASSSSYTVEHIAELRRLAFHPKQSPATFARCTLKFSLNRNTYRHTHIKNWIIEAR